VISYIRRNLVAFVALFIAIILSSGSVAYAANTIYSSDIVDGQVKNQDLADNAVGTKKIQDHSILGRDIKDNSLGGAQIKESTLGQVPNAKTIDGQPLDTLKQTDVTQLVETDECAQPNVWSQCDLDTLTVPAGHAYVLTVTSEITADPGNTAQTIEYCPAYTGPTCINAGFTPPAQRFGVRGCYWRAMVARSAAAASSAASWLRSETSWMSSRSTCPANGNGPSYSLLTCEPWS
jgi:hypothetical protein